MSFHEGSLPAPFALGASGGSRRRVDVVALGSGREHRNTPWAHGRRHYDVGGAVRTLDELHALTAFFEARRGALHGFRFRDPFDHKSCAPGAAVSPVDQALGIGDGETVLFPLCKRYGDDAAAYTRTIAKPVSGTIRIAVDGVELASDAFSADLTTGVVTLVSAPAADAEITAGFIYDTPVRFNVDQLDISLEGFGAGRAMSIPLIEIVA